MAGCRGSSIQLEPADGRAPLEVGDWDVPPVIDYGYFPPQDPGYREVVFVVDDLGDTGSADEGDVDAPVDTADAEPADADEVVERDTEGPVDPGKDEGEADAGDPCEASPLGQGCACVENDDCASGLCVYGGEERVCVEPCTDWCPEGFECAELSSEGSLFCLPRFRRLCQPCRSDEDCADPGDPRAGICLDFGPSGSFCGAQCGAPGDCPEGYACQDFFLGEGEPVTQCVRADGHCTCNEVGVALAMTTDCKRSNAFGTCLAERVCGPDGLSLCSAREPAEEICDLFDNDCDGDTDESEDVSPCFLANGFGSCPGVPTCVAGVSICEGEMPGPEQCDGVDNDCNGATDEDFPDTDADGIADCLDTDADSDGVLDDDDNCPAVQNADQADQDGDGEGDLCDADIDGDGSPNVSDCQPTDAQAFPGAGEICNRKDDDCDGSTDEEATECDDGVVCTFDFCDPQSAGCRHAPNDALCDDDYACTTDRCDAGSGCTHVPLANAPCDDGDACTVDDRCQQDGRCTGTALASCCTTGADCDDRNSCTEDICTDQGGCVHTVEQDGTACDADGDGCTQADSCSFGVCMPGPAVDCEGPAGACSEQACVSTGPTSHECRQQPIAVGTPCNDGNPCTTADTCDANGQCVGGTAAAGCCGSDQDCDDGNACTADTCDPTTRLCTYANVQDGSLCDADGNDCTDGDFCVRGACAVGHPVACPPPSDACHIRICTPVGSTDHECPEVDAPAGTICDDGDPCTTSDRCDEQAECVGNPVANCCTGAADCDDGNGCTTDACVSGTCTHAPVEDGQACATGTCLGGACQGGGPCQGAGCVVPDPAIMIMAGGKHTCAVRQSGPIECWGQNVLGQLGVGAPVILRQPAHTLNAVSNPAALSGGLFHTCGIEQGGAGFCVGSNLSAQLGHPNASFAHTTPIGVQGLDDAVSITAGDAHSCAARTGGLVSCWGSDASGQIGDGDTSADRARSPRDVAGVDGAVEVDAGAEHACARLADGGVRCWGANQSGQLGNGNAGGNTWGSVQVTGLDDAEDIACGAEHCCAVTATGTVRCWGRNNDGQLGDGGFDGAAAPIEVAGLTAAVEVGAGDQHSCARRDDGSVWCWGAGGVGQLGIGTETGSATAVPVPGAPMAAELEVGDMHTCVRTAEGSVWCWGWNLWGQVGSGSEDMVLLTPIRVLGF